MTAGSYCYIGPQGIVHGTTVSRTINITSLLLAVSLKDVTGFKSWKINEMSFDGGAGGQWTSTMSKSQRDNFRTDRTGSTALESETVPSSPARTSSTHWRLLRTV